MGHLPRFRIGDTPAERAGNTCRRGFPSHSTEADGNNGAPDLNDAVARLKALRSTWNPGDVIDTILSFVADFPSSD
ncbi:MAG: hypothetical protein EOO77_37445 [Oxalobacteraceae bacterium]|nr:MAG: hypothetical protein EOO77_37445 [Oxalobacteraceae bacterium]